MRRVIPFVLAVVMIAGVGGVARADIIFTLGNHPQSDENNILFGASQVGTTINGEVDHSGVGVVFTSLTGQTLVQKAKGQADIFATLGENPLDLVDLTSMDVTVPGFTFLDFILNLVNGTGTAHVVVTDNTGQTFEYNLGPGQNYLTMTIKPGTNETMSEIQVTMLNGGSFDEFKQPRISGVCNGEGCVPPTIPEPASMLLLGSGLIGLGGAARRRMKARN